MKQCLVMLLLLLGVTLVYAQDYRIVKAAGNKTISLQQMAKELKKYDLIFFGEFHDNSTLHHMQKELLPLIQDKKELILSFEMFERDVQDLLDAYLAGEISEADFLAGSRPWGNYDPDYKPLIEYAKANKLKALAANVPRRYAGKLARQGLSFREELDEHELDWISKEITAPDDEYKKAFLATMMGNGSEGHGMMGGNDALELMYLAQCLKDDTMAESIITAIKPKPKGKARVIHFNGDFHSHAFLGTVSRVRQDLPKLKIAVISPIYHPQWQSTSSQADKLAGTYLIYLPEPLRQEEGS